MREDEEALREHMERVGNALRRSELTFRTVIESSLDLISVVDVSGNYLYANPAHTTVFGVQPDELIGQNAVMALHPDDAGVVAGQLAEALATGARSSTVEYRVRHQDGTWHRFEGIALNLTDDPMIAGVLVTGRDITERARDAELHRMHAVRLGILQEIDRAILASQPPAALIASALDGLRQLTQSALAVALLWDSEAGVARVIAGRSEDARQWFPLTTLQLIEFSPAATFLEQPTIYVEDLSELVSASPIIERARRAGMRSLLTEALCSDGQLFGLLTFCAETVAAFEPDYRSVVREVANQLAIALLQERMRGQLQLHTLQLEERVRERTAELEAVNQDLETFSVSVSHDLRAPLRMLEGYSRLLKEALSESPGAEVSEYLSRIRASVRRMEELIEALLRLSRVARSEPRWESVYLSHLAEAAVADLRRRHPARKVEFLCAPFMVARGDREMLTIALENLLANAWKYTGRHPTALVEFGAQERDGMLVYFVRDDGAGFDIKSADNLFTPFRRLHRDDEFEGTGIGLATVQRIVRRHGGTIWAEAAVERGATFYFTLRLAS